MTNHQEYTSYRDWHLVLIVVHSWPLPRLKAMRKQCSEEFPDASREVVSNTYVDDCLSGADDVEATVKLQQSLDKMMERGGFNLTK